MEGRSDRLGNIAKCVEVFMNIQYDDTCTYSFIFLRYLFDFDLLFHFRLSIYIINKKTNT